MPDPESIDVPQTDILPRWERREILQLLSASVVPLGLTSCSKKKEDERVEAEPTPTLPDNLPFGIWKKMREALRKSPDHLAFQLDAVVATKDPKTIFEFVRDHFITRPDRYRGGSDIDFRDRVNWGITGLLRSGVGTPREKAELLQSLYTRAGFKARIMEGEMDIDAIGFDRLFFNNQHPRFAPDQTTAPIQQWKELLQSSKETKDSFLNEEDTQLKAIEFEALGEAAIISEIKSALGPDFKPENPDWGHLLRNTSIVGVEVDGKEHYANPHINDLSFGEHGLKDTPRIAGRQEPMETPRVKATLSASTSSKPYDRFPLVEGTWSAADLIGRQLKINFMSTEEPEILLRSRIGDLETFAPVLSVQAEGLSEDDVKRLSFAGDLITVHGDQITSKDDRILVNNQEASITDGNPENLKKVSSLEIEAEAGNWPEVKLRARVLDQRNQTVPDLPGACFQAIENGRAVPCQLLRNTPQAPRILFVFDYSGSMKPEFRGKGLAPLVREICTSASAKYGKVQTQLSVISYDTAGLRTFSPWLDKIDETENHILKYNPGGLQTSNYWTALATATNKDANLVVLFTDADGTEEGSFQQRTSITAGCPAVIIGVPSDKTKEDHLVNLAAASGGNHVLADDHATAAAAVLQRLDQDQNWPYLLSYHSPISAPEDPIKVVLQTSDEKNSTETRYEVKSPPQTSRSFAGLYLEVEIGNQKVFRTLAGLTPWKSKENPVTEKHAAETRRALFGNYQISFEGEAPTSSALLDNILGSFLSLEPLVSSLAGGTEKDMLKAIEKGAIRLPAYWASLNSPLGKTITKSTFTYQEGWRAILFSSTPSAEGHFVDRSDILSFTNWRTIAKDPGTAWATSLSHSLKLSLIETANFDTSTASLLNGKNLRSLTNSEFAGEYTKLQEDALKTQWAAAAKNREPLKRDELALVSSGSKIDAYWSLNRTSGSILGFLRNGSGGGSSDTERYYDSIDSGLQAFDQVMGKLNLVSPAFAVWVQLERIKVAKVKLATMLLMTMDGSVTINDFENQLRGELSDWARDTALDQAGNFISPLGTFNDLRGWYEMATGISGFISP